MKTIMISVLGMLMTTQAMAANQPTTLLSDTAVDYHYGMHLDIARVVSHSEIPAVCHVVPAELTYEDSNGEQHTVRYRVMGNGCQGS